MIYRAPMRARDRDDLARGVGAEYGLEHALVGIGAVAERALERFAAVPDGSFVWTQDSAGLYHLGRIAGPCREHANPVGLTHVRPAEWLERPFGPDEVPPAVAATFARGGRNFQRTHDRHAERRTAELWSEWSPRS
jgi:hypothetical protein